MKNKIERFLTKATIKAMELYDIGNTYIKDNIINKPKTQLKETDAEAIQKDWDKIQGNWDKIQDDWDSIQKTYDKIQKATENKTANDE